MFLYWLTNVTGTVAVPPAELDTVAVCGIVLMFAWPVQTQAEKDMVPSAGPLSTEKVRTAFATPVVAVTKNFWESVR